MNSQKPRRIGDAVCYVYGDYKLNKRVILPYGIAPTMMSATGETGGAIPLHLEIKRVYETDDKTC